MRVDYLRPTLIAQPLTLRARVVEASPRKTRISCSLYSDGKECARGDVLAVRVAHDFGG